MPLMLALALAAAVAAASPLADRADGIALRDLDGREIRLSDLRGRVVVIDVWATWCAPCLADLPMIRNLHRTYPDRVAIIGVSLDRMTRRDFVSWLRRHDVGWRQHFDGRGYTSPVARQLGVEALPATVLIAPDGRIAARNLRGDRLASAVRQLIHLR
jgi:thiol-disulfide isomerase/thioredoxin